MAKTVLELKTNAAIKNGLGATKAATLVGAKNAAVQAAKDKLGEVKTATLTGATNVADKTQQTQQTTPVAPENQTPDYSINYNDERFKEVEAQKQAAIDKSNETYNSMIQGSDAYYQGLMNEADRYAEEQKRLQNEKTDFAIEEINQQKQQAQEDYTAEQQGAYVDWQKQSDQYGASAEQMAESGLMGTGYSESSQVAMYTAYQNRVAVARQTFERANVEYNNAITEARMSNNSVLAEIAHDAWLKKAEYSLENFQYQNDLLQAKLDREQQLDSEYYSRWQDVLAQQNQENALAEEIRQYNADMEYQKYRDTVEDNQWQKTFDYQRDRDAISDQQWKAEMEVAKQQWQAEYDLQKQQFDETIRQFDEEMQRLKKQDAQENKLAIQQLELQKKELEQAKKQWKAEMKEEKRQFDATLKEEKRQFNVTSKKASGSSGSSSSSKSSSSSAITKSSSVSGTSSSTSTPTSAQKKTYSTFETNIGNLMIKNPSQSAIDSMGNQIEEAYEKGKITKTQMNKLFDLLS